MIQKKIHYIWFGKKKKTKLTEVCINSWKRVLKDYEIVEWNEDNIDIRKLCLENAFLKKCFELKLWAFVSDYIRLYILYNEGGIYLDTDVEVLKTFDQFLDNRMFLGNEENGYIGTAVIGAEKGNYTIKRLLEFYEQEIWDVDFYNNPIIFKYLYENDRDDFEGCKIYPQDFFSPYAREKVHCNSVETANSITIHWYSQNWNMSCKGYIFLNTKHIKNPFYKFAMCFKKYIGYKRKMFYLTKK